MERQNYFLLKVQLLILFADKFLLSIIKISTFNVKDCKKENITLIKN